MASWIEMRAGIVGAGIAGVIVVVAKVETVTSKGYTGRTTLDKISLLQTSFGHISINSSTILTILMTMESS